MFKQEAQDDHKKNNMLHQVASAISLTNHGAEKLATGEYFAAASAFCAAIKRTQSLAATTAEESTSFSASSSGDLDLEMNSRQMPWTYEALPVLSPDVLHNEMAIFEHCFVVVPAKQQAQFEAFTTVDCELFTAALIYNLALTYHYCGVCGHSTERMTESLGLYEKASSIIGQANQEEVTEDGLALYLAVSNNAASLSLVMQNKKKFQRFQARLQRVVREKDDFFGSFFLKNTMADHHTGAAIHNIPVQ